MTKGHPPHTSTSVDHHRQPHDGGFPAEVGQQTAHVVEANKQGGGIDQRVALHPLGLPNRLIHHQLHRALSVAYHGEQGDRARSEAKHRLQSLGRAEAQPFDAKGTRQRLEIDSALLRGHHQKQPFALGIAQEEVLGLGGGQVGQQPAGLLAGEDGGVIDALIGNGQLIQQRIKRHHDLLMLADERGESMGEHHCHRQRVSVWPSIPVCAAPGSLRGNGSLACQLQ